MTTPAATVARVRWLASPTSDAWLEQALAHPLELLIDHAHCERKAAGAALQLMFRYPSDEDLAAALSPLAREELEHFERVLALLGRRGQVLRPLAAPPTAPPSRSWCGARNPSACSTASWWPA